MSTLSHNTRPTTDCGWASARLQWTLELLHQRFFFLTLESTQDSNVARVANATGWELRVILRMLVQIQKRDFTPTTPFSLFLNKCFKPSTPFTEIYDLPQVLALFKDKIEDDNLIFSFFRYPHTTSLKTKSVKVPQKKRDESFTSHIKTHFNDSSQKFSPCWR